MTEKESSSIFVKMLENIVSVGHTTGIRKPGDGKVSSVLFATSLIAAMAACIFTNQNMSLQNNNAVIWYILLVLLIISTLFWAAFFVLSYCRPDTFIVISTDINRTNSLIRSVLWIFGLGVVLYQLLNTIIDFNCSGEAYGNISSITYVQAGLGRIVHIVSVCIQLIAITRLSNYELKSNIFVNYCLSFILMTNVVMWAFMSSRVLFDTINEHVHINETNPSPAEQCYWNSTIQILVLQKCKSIFVSFMTNSSLLSVCIITNMLPDKQNHRVSKDSASNNECETNHDGIESPEVDVSLLQNTFCKYIHTLHFRIHRNTFVFLLLGLMTLLPCFVLFIYSLFENIFTNVTMTVCWMMFSTLSLLVMVVTSLYGFRVSHKPPYITDAILHKGLLRNPFVSILLSLGDISYCVFVILSSGDRVFSNLFYLRYWTEIFQVYFQTILMIVLATQYKISRTLTKGPCGFLMCGNLLFWIFNEYSRYLNDPTCYFGTHWFSVKDTVFPILSFYRLYSFMHFLRYALL